MLFISFYLFSFFSFASFLSHPLETARVRVSVWFGFGGLVFERRAVSSRVVTLDHVILDCRSRISDLYPRTTNPVKDYFQEFTIFFT